MKSVSTHIRRDGRSQGSFLQALPVETFKPPNQRQSSVSFVLDFTSDKSEQFPLTHLCFWMSLTPFFRFPSLSEGLSLSRQTGDQ